MIAIMEHEIQHVGDRNGVSGSARQDEETVAGGPVEGGTVLCQLAAWPQMADVGNLSSGLQRLITDVLGITNSGENGFGDVKWGILENPNPSNPGIYLGNLLFPITAQENSSHEQFTRLRRYSGTSTGSTEGNDALDRKVNRLSTNTGVSGTDFDAAVLSLFDSFDLTEDQMWSVLQTIDAEVLPN